MGKPVYENNWQYNDEDWKQIEKSRLYKYTDHFGDPYNVDNRSVISNGDTIRSQLRKLGIEMLTNRKSTVEERIRKVQQRMADIYIDKDLFELITAIQQSRYPQRPENSNTSTSQTKPIHNEFSHFRTALEYLIDNLPSVSPNLNMTSNSIIVPRIVGMDLF
ncbi:MAG: hypothetical protein LBG59_07050 [Candidatus Peribacteria bacterium]|nr:hypothetical protein [Candidatus Peribacteria bacterium]